MSFKNLNLKVRLSPRERLLIWRRRQGLTQEAAAARLGVKFRTLRSWEEGARNPRPENAALILALDI